MDFRMAEEQRKTKANSEATRGLLPEYYDIVTQN